MQAHELHVYQSQPKMHSYKHTQSLLVFLYHNPTLPYACSSVSSHQLGSVGVAEEERSIY